jgi:hypothetical protein
MSGQNIIEKVETAYNKLDSLSYMNKVNLAIYKDNEEKFAYMDKNKDNTDSLMLKWFNIYPSPDSWTKLYFDDCMNKIQDKKTIFVLHLVYNSRDSSINIDDCEFNFDIYYFGKNSYPHYYTFFRYCRLNDYVACYPTFSRAYAKKIKKGFKSIMQKKPKYLLDCKNIKNSLLYLKEDKIYVYDVIYGKHHELNNYLKNISY